MQTFRTGLWRWGPALALMALIFTASSMPGPQLPQFGGWDFIVKKGGHALGYALLAAAYGHGLAGGRPVRGWQRVVAVLAAALYALTDEYHQSFVAGRTPSLRDVGIDTTGATAGVAAAAFIQILARRARPRLPSTLR